MKKSSFLFLFFTVFYGNNLILHILCVKIDLTKNNKFGGHFYEADGIFGEGQTFSFL